MLVQNAMTTQYYYLVIFLILFFFCGRVHKFDVSFDCEELLLF